MNTAEYNAILSALGSLALFLFVFLRRKKKKKILMNCIETDGFIIDYETDQDGDGTFYLHPIIRFQLENTEWVTVKYSVGFYFRKKLKDNKIRIQYSVSDYKNFIIKGLPDQLNAILLLAGVSLVLYSVFLFYEINFP